MGIGGRIIGAVAIGGIATFGGVSAMGDETTRNDQGEIIESGGLGVFAMKTGDCFIVPVEELVESVEAVPCTEPHDGQMVGKVFTALSGSYNDLGVWQSAVRSCAGPFTSFVGSSPQASALVNDAFYPSKEMWDANDRQAICVAMPRSGKVSFDARGSKK